MSDVAVPVAPLHDETSDPSTQPRTDPSQGEDGGRQQDFSHPDSRWKRRRREFLRTFLAQLDQLIFIELAGLYYIDNSPILLVLRSMVQLGVAGPTLYPAALKPRDRRLIHRASHLALVWTVNFFALLLHTYLNMASAGESTRGYLHGSLIIDFIGQKAWSGWASRIRLCTLDVVLLILQILACGVVEEMNKKEPLIIENTVERVGTSRALNVDTPATQDATSEGIELQPLLPRPVEIEPDFGDSREQEEESPQAWQRLNSQYAGQSTLFDFYVLDTHINQYWDYRNRRQVGAV